MATSDCFASVIAPLDNDADIVAAFARDVLAVLKRTYENYELVLVDDGSADATAEVVTALLAEERCIRLIRLSRRFGRDIAISAGLDTVIGDFVVVLVPETDPPELIPQFIERCRRGPGIVYGIRARRPAEPLYLSLGTRVFYWYFNRIVGVELPRNSTDFRAYSRQSVNAITRIHDRLRYLRTFGAYVGFGGEPFVYEPRPRRARVRRRTPFEAIGLAINMTVANSTQPLRIVSLLGLALSALSGLHALYVLVVRWLDPGIAAGWTTQQVYVSAMFMVLFLVLATLCEYMGRLLGEVMDRPLYFVLEERNSGVLLVDEHRKNVVTDSD